MEEPVIITVKITEVDMKALVVIRNYFGNDDRTNLDQLAYDVLDRVVSDWVQSRQKIEG